MADGVKMNGSSNGGVNGYGPLTGSAPMSPLSSSLSSILQQPEESIPFVPLSPALLNDEYMLGLGDEQGISDLFDSCDLDTLALDDLLRIWAIPETDRTRFQVSWWVLLSSWMKSGLARLVGVTLGMNYRLNFMNSKMFLVAFDIDRLRMDLTTTWSKVSVVWYCTDGFLYPDNVVLKLFLVWWIAWAVWFVYELCHTGFPDGTSTNNAEKSQFLQNGVFIRKVDISVHLRISCLLSWWKGNISVS